MKNISTQRIKGRRWMLGMVDLGVGAMYAMGICSMTALGISCSHSNYKPLNHKVVRTDTVIKRDTVYRRVEGQRTDTIVRERTIRLEVTDSVAPRLSPEGQILGWDRYRFQRETDHSSEDRSRFVALIDSLKEISRSKEAVRDAEVREIAVEVPTKRNWKDTLMMALVIGLGILGGIIVGKFKK